MPRRRRMTAKQRKYFAPRRRTRRHVVKTMPRRRRYGGRRRRGGRRGGSRGFGGIGRIFSGKLGAILGGAAATLLGGALAGRVPYAGPIALGGVGYVANNETLLTMAGLQIGQMVPNPLASGTGTSTGSTGYV